MAIDQGVVVGMGTDGNQMAWVETIRSSACASCASKDSCNASANIRKVEAINEIGARVGDRIQLAMDTAALLKATFLLYLFPILCMLAGAFAGNALAIPLNITPSYVSLAGALITLTVALLFVRVGGNKLARKAAYKPKIIRVIGTGPLPQTDLDTPNPCTTQKATSS